MVSLDSHSCVLLVNSAQKGVAMPLLGLGTWEAGGDQVQKAVYHALKVGYRLIDTARIYGNEREVGLGIRDAMRDFSIKRKDIFVTTKLWNTDHVNPIAAFEESLARLGLDYLDLYLIHWPVTQRLRSWGAMQALLDQKKVRALGVSNFTIIHLDQLKQSGLPLPSVNQVEFSPFLYQKDLLKYCQNNKIALEAYSPLTRGERLDEDTIKKIAQRHKVSVAQIMLRWALQHGLITIPKSITPKRIEENANLFHFSLTQDDMSALDLLNSEFRTCWNPEIIP